MTANENPFKPAIDPNTQQTRTEYDHLPLPVPGNKRAPDLDSSTLANVLISAGVPEPRTP